MPKEDESGMGLRISCHKRRRCRDAADVFFRVFTFPLEEFHRDPRKFTNNMFDTS